MVFHQAVRQKILTHPLSYQLKHHFPNLVAKEIDKTYKVLNLHNGGSNYSILEDCKTLPFHEAELVVVQFTDWVRGYSELRAINPEELSEEKINSIIFKQIEEIIESVQVISKKGSKNILDGAIEPLKGQLDKDEVIELEKAKKSGDLENFLSKLTSENTAPSTNDPTYTTFKRKFKDAGITMPRGIHKSNKKNFETWFEINLKNTDSR